jgi:hypothetical protein
VQISFRLTGTLNPVLLAKMSSGIAFELAAGALGSADLLSQKAMDLSQLGMS